MEWWRWAGGALLVLLVTVLVLLRLDTLRERFARGPSPLRPVLWIWCGWAVLALLSVLVALVAPAWLLAVAVVVPLLVVLVQALAS
jgi:hypothetical protein